MAQLLVRNLEQSVKTKLQRRARRHGRSMEEEVREILRDVTRQEGHSPQGGLGTEIAARFRKLGLRKGEEIQELRDIRLQIPDFAE